MTNSSVSTPVFKDSKPHYPVLDGLRGIAAITVVCFHIFEAFASTHLDQRINHGYLAVDFFFILSGFVVGYAYDDRWDRMTTKDFIQRRLIRLHPMVIAGALMGAGLFYFQECSVWDVTQVTVSSLFIATLLNALLLPALPGQEVRGLGEMFPLNGPSWSLLFEYIGNILYALVLRRLSTGLLGGVVAMAACGLAIFAVWGPLGDICAGFSLTSTEFTAGSLRFLFSFSAGLLLSRVFKPFRFKGAFWTCGLILVALLALPRIGGAENLWMNGLYDTFCCVMVFPLLVVLGASGTASDRLTNWLCKFLGDISYPLYMVHYPFIYVYYAWVKNEQLTFEQSLPGAAAVVFGSIVLAYGCLRYYDIPVRKYLTQRFLTYKRK
ncbi:acyltransferase family protein [Sphingobacterium thalpophilum]|uniref:acyltransferase family protein n=1 Tax=Sphingobacterium thalpophilum TaxID=259 RepID=UPI0024A6BBC0|nr:acyltransferase [Sphingobacterium thalpophilum]